MPGMSGLQLAERLKPLRPEMKTLFVSGCAHDDQGHTGLPPAEILAKPFPTLELVKRVRTLLRRPPALAR